MINLSKEYIDSLATNASAMKNGNKLSRDGSFVKLNKSEDESIIFGECKGSGKNNYICSADFINESNPVFRCGCPSKQFPCKHTLGLMYAFADGKEFTVDNIPEDIIEKRGKIEKREQNKIEKKKVPAKKNKTAIKKKINAQLEGIELLDNEVDNENALMQAIYLKSLVKEGKKHLENRLEDEELNFSISSDIEELLGHAWKLTELEELGQFKKDANLVQLSFSSYVDIAREEYIDEGIFLDLNTGEIRNTYNYRPVRRKSDAEGEIEVLEGCNKKINTCTQNLKIEPVIQALTSNGGGRYAVIEDGFKEGVFSDTRLLPLLIKGLDDKYGEIGQLIYDKLSLDNNEIPLFLLQETFNSKGKKGDVLRLRLMAKA